MKSSFQRDFWIYSIVAVLAAILVTCVTVILLLLILGQPISDLLAALSVAAANGLFRLLILPPLD